MDGLAQRAGVISLNQELEAPYQVRGDVILGFLGLGVLVHLGQCFPPHRLCIGCLDSRFRGNDGRTLVGGNVEQDLG